MNESSTWLQNCSNYSYSAYSNDNRCRTIYYARAVAASLSIIGCLLVLCIILLYRKYTRFTQRLVLYLVIPTLVVAGVALDPIISNDRMSCAVSGFLFNWAILSQRFIILCIVIHLLVFSFQSSRPWYLEAAFHVFIWGFSLVLSLIPLFGNHYGSAGVWCWIQGRSHYELYDLRIYCFYFWAWLCIVVEIVCFSLVIARICKQLHQLGNKNDPILIEMKRKYREYMYPLMLYPLVNLILAIPVTINRVQNMLDPLHPIYPLFLVHSVVYPLWGFFNMMMYFMNKETMQQLNPCTIINTMISSTPQEEIRPGPVLGVPDAALHTTTSYQTIQTME